MEGSSLGVRKGAWTQKEDLLLKKCIQTYGEGKWHQVPAKAGLNRCRRSCRLRWLNYLKPNIKRGDFAADEVDLILRLHKLFGNRWSLIAGRLPGRTANDVKNYWNTHLLKKLNPSNEDSKTKHKPKPHQNPSKPNINVIEPRPRTLSVSSLPKQLDRNNNNNNDNAAAVATATPAINKNISLLADSYNDKNGYSSICSDNDEIIWWENLLMNVNEIDDQQRAFFNNSHQSGLGNHAMNEELGEIKSMVVEEGNDSVWGDLFCDVELWNVF